MSRSYRKPYWTEVNKSWSKRQANKRVRKMKDLPNGKSYRKVYNTWDITDYRFLCPENTKMHRK